MVSLPFYPPLDPPLITAPAMQTDYQAYYPHKTVWFCQTPQYWGHYAALGVGDEYYFPLCFTESSKVAVHKQPSAGEKGCSPLDWMSFPVCSAHGGWGVWHPDLREGWGGSTHTTVLRAGRNMSREVMPAIDSSTGLENWLEISSLQGQWFPIFHLLCSRHHTGCTC